MGRWLKLIILIRHYKCSKPNNHCSKCCSYAKKHSSDCVHLITFCGSRLLVLEEENPQPFMVRVQ